MADFPYSPDFGYKVKPDYNVLESTFENKTVQTRLKSAKKLRTYELPFSNRSDTEVAAVNTFFDSKKGNLNSFTISIEGVDILGRIMKGTYFTQRIAPKVYTYGFNFQEVVNAT